MKQRGRCVSATQTFRLAAILCALLLPVIAQAEYLGLLAGRQATPAQTSDLSVELGIVNGDLGDEDYQNIAARVNYRLTPELVFTGTAGISEFGLTDGIPVGLGLMYHLSNQRISQLIDIAGRASYHFGDYSFRDDKVDLSTLSLEVLISGREPIMLNGMSWYSNVGFHRTTVDSGASDTESDAGLGVGVVLPTGLGEAYLGFEYIDNLLFGLGFRYFLE